MSRLLSSTLASLLTVSPWSERGWKMDRQLGILITGWRLDKMYSSTFSSVWKATRWRQHELWTKDINQPNDTLFIGIYLKWISCSCLQNKIQFVDHRPLRMDKEVIFLHSIRFSLLSRVSLRVYGTPEKYHINNKAGVLQDHTTRLWRAALLNSKLLLSEDLKLETTIFLYQGPVVQGCSSNFKKF